MVQPQAGDLSQSRAKNKIRMTENHRVG